MSEYPISIDPAYEEPIMLLDLDGVLADFDTGFKALWEAYKGNDIPALEPALRRHFRIVDDYPAHVQPEVEQVIQRSGFYAALPPMPGAIEAVQHFTIEGYSLWICSSLPSGNNQAAADKLTWIRHHLGASMLKRVIFTADKTLIQAHLLIDDCPNVQGIRKPDWQQVLFNQPYNKLSSLPRINWNEEGLAYIHSILDQYHLRAL